jgi:hypothetical protein
MERSAGIGALVRRMEGLLEPLEASRDPGRFFLVNSARFLGQMSWLVDHAAAAA